MKRNRNKPRPAFLVIKSAEGRRSVPRQKISREQFETEREEIAKSGIGWIRSWWA